MERYLNRSGDSGVTHYELGADFIRVRFAGGMTYHYGHVRPGQHHVDRMKALAIAGRGLGTYISQHVRDQYEGRELRPNAANAFDAAPAAFVLIEHKEHTTMKPKNTICLWFDKDAHDAARFYAATFPNSKVTAVHHAPSDYPSGKKGDVLTVEFTVLGIPCLGLNGGPQVKHTDAFSFQVATDNQEETDRYWNAIVGNGGQESQCGWCRDRWGVSWQITPRALTEALAAGGAEAKRAFEAMMPMKKIDVATIEAARRG